MLKLHIKLLNLQGAKYDSKNACLFRQPRTEILCPVERNNRI